MKDRIRVEKIEVSSELRPRTLYIDCSSTFHTGLNTGIQRVVRNIVNRAGSLSKTFDIPCVPVVYAYGRTWATRNIRPVKFYLKIDRTIKRTLGILDRVATLIKSLIPEGKPKEMLKKFFGKIHTVTRNLWHLVQTVLAFPFLKEFQPVTISEKDLLLAADAFWTHGVSEYLEKISLRGVPVITVIYDLIPVTHPEYVDDNNRKAFLSALDRVLSISKGAIGISKAVRDDVIDYLDKKDGSAYKNMAVDYFYLGSDLGNEKQAKTGKIRKWPDQLWDHGEVYLMVGTIEPRKGYDFVLDAFEKMWAEGSDMRLLVIGRIGWKCNKLIARFNDSPYRGSKLFVFHDINDKELIHCYSNATALVFASRVEGFGLPLVEAMERGIPAVASDIPVFREIGGDYPVYFSLDSVDSLIEALHLVLEKGHEHQSWISWDESANMLIRKTLAIFSEHRATEARGKNEN